MWNERFNDVEMGDPYFQKEIAEKKFIEIFVWNCKQHTKNYRIVETKKKIARIFFDKYLCFTDSV